MPRQYQVSRTHISPYQSKNFLSLEKNIVEQFQGLSYHSLSDIDGQDVILITNTHTQLKDLPPSLLKRTRLIIHPNSGYDHFADEHDLWKDIPMVIGHTIRAQAVAEYSLAAVFEGLTELPLHMTWHKERTWNRKLLKGTETWIFGYGHIGKIIADTLHAIGMKITVVDPYISSCPYRHLSHWGNGNIQDARVVIAAMSLNSTSSHLFNERFFQAIGNEVLLINGARGKLVDEKSLRSYLQLNPDSFAFLDVFEKEPFGEDWHGFPQVWKTSHIAGVEKDLDNKILEFERAVLQDYLKHDEDSFAKKYEKELIQNKWMKGVLI